jgi:hypothetical protein
MKWTVQTFHTLRHRFSSKLEALGVTEAKTPVRLLRSLVADRVGNNAP